METIATKNILTEESWWWLWNRPNHTYKDGKNIVVALLGQLPIPVNNSRANYLNRIIAEEIFMKKEDMFDFPCLFMLGELNEDRIVTKYVYALHDVSWSKLTDSLMKRN